MHVTNRRVLKKKRSHVIAYNLISTSVEWNLDESQCKCVEFLHSDGSFFFFSSYYVTHCRVNVFCFLFFFFF